MFFGGRACRKHRRTFRVCVKMLPQTLTSRISVLQKFSHIHCDFSFRCEIAFLTARKLKLPPLLKIWERFLQEARQKKSAEPDRRTCGAREWLQHLVHEYAVLVVVGLYVGVDLRLHLRRKAAGTERAVMVEQRVDVRRLYAEQLRALAHGGNDEAAEHALAEPLCLGMPLAVGGVHR